MKYSSHHFALFRGFFGAYLTVYFLCLLPYADELFGTQSAFVNAPSSGFSFKQVFPSILDNVAIGEHPTVFLLLLAGLALAFMVGVGRWVAALLLWYGLTCLVNRNPGIMNPSHAFVGWLCLASAIVPLGEVWGLRRSRETWAMPSMLYWGAWWVMAFAYSASAIAKLKSPGWVDGTAIAMTLDMAYARDGWMRSTLLTLPSIVLRLCTWSVLATELLFLPMALLASTRRLIWSAAVVLHCALLVLFDFWELSVGMLLFHVFTFDERWLDATPQVEGRLAAMAQHAKRCVLGS